MKGKVKMDEKDKAQIKQMQTMLKERTNSLGAKISFFDLLTLVFITLKLTNVINWSWWLVLLPLYGGAIVTIIVFAIALYAMQKQR